MPKRITIGKEAIPSGYDFVPFKSAQEVSKCLHDDYSYDDNVTIIVFQNNLELISEESIKKLFRACYEILADEGVIELSFVNLELSIIESEDSSLLYNNNKTVLGIKVENFIKFCEELGFICDKNYINNFNYTQEIVMRKPALVNQIIASINENVSTFINIQKRRVELENKSFGFYKEVINLKSKMQPFYNTEDKLQNYALNDNHFEWYYSIAKQLNPNLIVGVNVSKGYSAAALLLGCPYAAYLGYGKEGEYSLDEARSKLNSFEDVTLIKTDTQRCISFPLLEFDRADLICINTHIPIDCIHDCDLALKALNKNGIILVDNIDNNDLLFYISMWADVHELYWEYYPTLYGVLTISREP